MPPRPGCRLRSGPPGGRYLMYFAPCGGQAFSTALALYSVDIHELSVVVVVGIVTKMPPPPQTSKQIQTLNFEHI